MAKTLLSGLVIALIIGFTVRNLNWTEPKAEPLPEPNAGIECFRAGGAQQYCACLDRLASARSAARLAAPQLGPLDNPSVRYAMRFPERYPVINADTPRCVRS